ncbi:MAG: thiazole synthase [Betaproteobacteria bacterium AqS2]|uniref:thiazole synthase n=1 Tax=Candidatus Amphirhobacter heronislandensis TaxID=1732024 RepID=A0A930Y3D2_9GAMM|nr:thiazole synthase [Betaproteobacteria bacterium AqS2]
MAGRRLASRLLLGTSRYPSPAALADCVARAGPGLLTVSVRRSAGGGNAFYELLKEAGPPLVPNTAGCRTVAEACRTASMARELLGTNWVKLELIGDDETQAPDPFALVEAAEQLLREDYVVLAYCTEDLALCTRLAPIGSGQGLNHPERLALLRQRLAGSVLVVDAGIGRPSDAAAAMELGYDAVLLNTAVALAREPAPMAAAFRAAVDAGRTAYRAGIMPRHDMAQPSTLAPDIPVERYHPHKETQTQ